MPDESRDLDAGRRMMRKWHALLVIEVLTDLGASMAGVIAGGYALILLISPFVPVSETFRWWPFPLFLVGSLGLFRLRGVVRRRLEYLSRELFGS